MNSSSMNIRQLRSDQKKLSLKLVRLEKQFTFLNDCLNLRCVPRIITIKQHEKFSGANALYANFNFRLMSSIILSTHEKWQLLHKKLKQPGFSVHKSCKDARCLSSVIAERHRRKLNKLRSRSINSELPVEDQYQFSADINLPESTRLKSVQSAL